MHNLQQQLKGKKNFCFYYWLFYFTLFIYLFFLEEMSDFVWTFNILWEHTLKNCFDNFHPFLGINVLLFLVTKKYVFYKCTLIMYNLIFLYKDNSRAFNSLSNFHISLIRVKFNKAYIKQDFQITKLLWLPNAVPLNFRTAGNCNLLFFT